MAPPRRVVVKSIKGFQTLTLEGQALAALMNQQAKTRRWEGKSRSDVVREVSSENGYDGAFVDIEDTTEIVDVINQTAETDARFLKRLAAREGFAFWIDNTGLHFHRRKQDAAPVHVFTWYSDERGEVISINVESDLVKRAGSVAVKGRDPVAKTTIDASSSADTAKRSTLGDVIEVVDPKTGTTTLLKRNATASVAPTSSSTATAAGREAEARFVKAERETVKLTMQVVGDATFAAKSIVEVHGISSLLSGKYYVTDAKHSISSSGYTCDLKLSRDAKGKAADGGAKPQTGDKNAAALKKAGEKKQVEMIDPVTGESHVEYHDDGAGSADPEAKPGKKGGG
jgi:phage protein D